MNVFGATRVKLPVLHTGCQRAVCTLVSAGITLSAVHTAAGLVLDPKARTCAALTIDQERQQCTLS
jgi:hypothetical protein